MRRVSENIGVVRRKFTYQPNPLSADGCVVSRETVQSDIFEERKLVEDGINPFQLTVGPVKRLPLSEDGHATGNGKLRTEEVHRYC